MKAMAGGQEVNGRELVSGIEQFLPVIDGEFVAIESDRELPSVVLRAVDSSWWEIISHDAEVLDAIRKRFRQVEEHEYDAA